MADDRPTLTQLAADLGVKMDTLSKWLWRNHAADLGEAIRDGGRVVLVGSTAESGARQHYTTSSGKHSTLSSDPMVDANVESMDTADHPLDTTGNRRIDRSSTRHRLDATDRLPTTEPGVLELARALSDAQLALGMERGRADELRRENERLLSERQAATARAEAAEMARDAARGDADHWRARWHELGTAWMSFYVGVKALTWWRRRHMPEPPEECRAQPRVRG
jgi:hypothetical protein